jgi:Uma2 family endonuclease
MASSSLTNTGAATDVVLPRSPGGLRLQSGDHLDRATFHERYLAMPPEFRAELVDGVVIVSSPTSPQHGHPHNHVAMSLGIYEAHTPGTRSYNNTTVYPNAVSEVQPDNMLIVLPEFGGQLLNEGGHLAGGPEFIAEVAYSSESYDLHSKLRVYERAGVLEYFVLLLRERRTAWFVRHDDRLQPRMAEQGIVQSPVFPGLWLDEAALLDGDAARVLATLQRGLATPEHAEFVQRLQRSRA